MLTLAGRVACACNQNTWEAEPRLGYMATYGPGIAMREENSSEIAPLITILRESGWEVSWGSLYYSCPFKSEIILKEKNSKGEVKPSPKGEQESGVGRMKTGHSLQTERSLQEDTWCWRAWLFFFFLSQCTTFEQVLDRGVTIHQADYKEGPLGYLLGMMNEQVSDRQESKEASTGCGQ